MRRRREECRDRERERGEDSSSFFWMSQAQVRRGGKDEQEAGSRGEAAGEREGERERERGGERGGGGRETVRKRERRAATT